jgi:NAD+ synthase
MPYYSAADDETVENLYRFDPETLLQVDDSEAQQLQKTITDLYTNQLQLDDMDGYVVGLSGGIDSTTTAYLLEEAVGAENVTGVLLPPPYADSVDADARTVVRELDLETSDYQQFHDGIGEVVDTLEELGQTHADEQVQKVKRGNILARCRMIVLRDIARANNYLVAGTTNASERMLGYMTLAADGKGGVDNEALYNLYKTTVRSLADHIGVPQEIIEKQPSADLWPGQADSDELGFAYDVLDRVLLGLELDMETDEIVDAVPPVNAADVDAIRQLVERMQFKRELAPHPTF